MPLTARPRGPGVVAVGHHGGVPGGLRRAAKQQEKNGPIDLGIVKSFYAEQVPTLHNEVERAYRLQKLAPRAVVPVAGGAAGEVDRRRQAGPGRPAGRGCANARRPMFNFAWLTAPGTPVFLAALVSMLLLRMSRAQVGRVFRKTFVPDEDADPDDRAACSA